MSVAILGGMDRLKCYYIKQGRDLGFSSVKVFSRKFPNMLKRLKGFSGIVICTGNGRTQWLKERSVWRKQMGSHRQDTL
ncbi:MAG TPA: hypothetical protein EYN05_03180 [Nitrospinaceae bacterium]|nr:hypothetical protein [Nitrospinaceae bacterium]